MPSPGNNDAIFENEPLGAALIGIQLPLPCLFALGSGQSDGALLQPI
jgi:hypothetical protein